MNKTSLFRAYNAARGLGLDRKRLNKALGIAQTKNADRRYITTLTDCTCPDRQYRPGELCKHIIAANLAALN